MISNDAFFSFMLATTRILFNAPPQPAYVPVTKSTHHALLLTGRMPMHHGNRKAAPANEHARLALEALSSDAPERAAQPSRQGRFIAGTAGNQAGRRDYKLYTPSTYRGQPLPLVVMLHGCTQDPDDFALATGMNRLAEEQSFFVLYPAQSETANTSRCWNWFSAGDQLRDKGEPSILADVTREVIRLYRIDRESVYVAGHSAGGSMAGILAKTYPDLYAAVGIHSGMPYASVRNAFFALHAMRYGSSDLAGSALAAEMDEQAPVPAIVFHGDMDETIHPQNGEKIIVAQGLQSVADAEKNPESPAPVSVFHEGASTHAYSHTVTSCHERQGHSRWEYWVIHGAGHNWSGGNPQGSYADARGPDASRELIRFFFSRSRRTSSQEEWQTERDAC